MNELRDCLDQIANLKARIVEILTPGVIGNERNNSMGNDRPLACPINTGPCRMGYEEWQGGQLVCPLCGGDHQRGEINYKLLAELIERR